MDDDMGTHYEASDPQSEEQEHRVQTSLDYVVQNLQSRLGNYRNRCFANGPFRLWAWAGSFLQGPQLWQRTTAAVMAALDVVNITTLATLKPLWKQFDDMVQDDASHFVQELVRLSDSNKVIRQYHHVDFRQEIHL